MVFVVQMDNESGGIEILLDDKALALLKSIVNKDWHEPVKKDNGSYDLDHEHLSSGEWGGCELTPEYTSEGASKIETVKIIYIGKEGVDLIS